MNENELVKEDKKKPSISRLTLELSTDLFCKIKAHASFQNSSIKCFVSSILYKEILKIEKEERAKLLAKK